MTDLRASSNSRRIIIALDFDGTLFDHPGTDYPKPGPPITSVIRAAKIWQKYARALLVVWTCRSKGAEIDLAVKALEAVELEVDGINENVTDFDPPSRKIYATAYIDDRAPGSIEWFIKGAEQMLLQSKTRDL